MSSTSSSQIFVSLTFRLISLSSFSFYYNFTVNSLTWLFKLGIIEFFTTKINQFNIKFHFSFRFLCKIAFTSYGAALMFSLFFLTGEGRFDALISSVSCSSSYFLTSCWRKRQKNRNLKKNHILIIWYKCSRFNLKHHIKWERVM